MVDTRQARGKERMVGIGMRLFAVVAVDRDQVRRIVSMREVNRREGNRYLKLKAGTFRAYLPVSCVTPKTELRCPVLAEAV